MKDRLKRWLDSDLVGVVATAYTFGVLAVSLAVFRFGGPIAGIVVAIALWIPMVVFAIRGAGQPPAPLGVSAAPSGGRHRVLVIANHGLEDPALCAEVCRRADRAETEAMVLAPVFASSRLGGVSDDVGEGELKQAQQRVEAAVATLNRNGVEASGHVTVTEPMQSLLDGLREFPPNEVVLLPGRETGWQGTDTLAERVREEVGLPVTSVSATS
jgi:hypothetical protein